MAVEEKPRKVHKKKGKSFLQKAKKFGRQGQRGKGTEIEQDQYDYLVRVMERWRDGFQDDEEKSMFVANVLEQTVGQERMLCGNQLASRVMELILPSADPKVLTRFCSALDSDLRLTCMDPFMSHVLEKLLLLRTFRKEQETDNLSQEEVQEARDWVVKVCKFVTNNLEDFCQDTYASHILRTCTQCLAGSRFPEEKKPQGVNNQQTEGYMERIVPRFGEGGQDLDEVMETFTMRIFGQEPEVLTSELCVRVLQVYLKVVHSYQPKTARGVVKHILTVCYGNPDLIDWEDSSVVRLLECIIEVAVNHSKLGTKILDIILGGGKLAELAAHPVANFVVQRVAEYLQDKERFVALVTEVAGEERLETQLSVGVTGVLMCLTKAAVRLEAGQALLLASITSALHCTEHQDQLALLLAHLVTREACTAGDLPPVNLHGSVVLQQILQFSKPIKVVRSVLSLQPSQLANLLSDPRGCHVTNSFMTSKSIGEKSREGLVKALKGEFVGLACSKHGSRTVDSLWKYSGMKSKQAMVEEFAFKVDILNSNKFGKFIAQKCFASVFKRSKEDWRKLIDKEEKVEEMFSEILGDDSKAVKKRKISDAEMKPETVSPKIAKTEPSAIVDDWLKDDVKPAEKKKKVKSKSYLDDL